MSNIEHLAGANAANLDKRLIMLCVLQQSNACRNEASKEDFVIHGVQKLHTANLIKGGQSISS